MDDATLSASEVHEGVVIGDAEVAEGSGQHVPGRWRVRQSVGMVVLGLTGMARGVEPPLQDAICESR